MEQQQQKISSETARRVVSNPRRSIEDACLKPLHHPGKLALLDPGSGHINGLTYEINSDVALAAEGARIACERAAAASAQQEHQSSLSLLCDQALAAETEHDQKNLEYGDISAAARAHITKALFQLESKAGFSKIKAGQQGKNAEVKLGQIQSKLKVAISLVFVA